MKRLCAALGVIAVSAVAAMPVAGAAQPPAKTFVAVLSAEEEVPLCAQATNAARGVAIFHVRDGTVDFKVIANNLPGNVSAAHIHEAPAGVPGDIVEPLPLTGAENGVVATGTFTDAALVADIQTDPDNFYVNVHSNVCGPGVIRGQLDDRGPLNN
jgi:Cu/Zn superoxide dismutase